MSYSDDPDGHRYCCRPHENSEAEWSNLLAERRARGELNPEVWPPVVNGDSFEVAAVGSPVGDPSAEPAIPARTMSRWTTWSEHDDHLRSAAGAG